MGAWFAANIGNIVISLFLIAVVAAIIVYLIRQKQQGKSTCGNSCAHCALHGECHKK